MKIKYVLFVLLFVPIISYSQVINNYGFKLGIVSSKTDLKINPSDIYLGSYNWFEKRRLGISFGLFLHMFDTKYFDFESELFYHEEGSEDEVIIATTEHPDGTGDYLVVDHEFDFIKLNLNLRPKYKLTSSVLFLNIGPSFNFLVKNRGEFYFENLNKFHLGFTYGFGLELNNLLNNTIIIEFKSNNYIGKFADTDRAEAEMSSWQVNIGAVLK